MEKKVYELLNKPTRSPYGNPIPGLEALGVPDEEPIESSAAQVSMGERNLAFPGLTGSVVVRPDLRERADQRGVLRQLHAAGIDPGATVTVAQERDGGDHRPVG